MTVLNSLDLDEAIYFVRPYLVPNCLQMTTVDTSGKIGTSMMTLELLESPELDYIHFWCIYRGGSRISGKGVHMYKGTGFAFLILSHFS